MVAFWLALALGLGNGGADYARLFQVSRSADSIDVVTFTGPKNRVDLTYVGTREVDSGKPAEMGDWNAGGGVFVSPLGDLSLYMTAHDNQGPSVNGRNSIEAGEWSAP